VRLVRNLFMNLIAVTTSKGGTRSVSMLSKLNSGGQRAAVRSAKFLRNLSEAIGDLALGTDTTGCGREVNTSGSGCGREANTVDSGCGVGRGLHGAGR
jgi:hypothetical protein